MKKKEAATSAIEENQTILDSNSSNSPQADKQSHVDLAKNTIKPRSKFNKRALLAALAFVLILGVLAGYLYDNYLDNKKNQVAEQKDPNLFEGGVKYTPKNAEMERRITEAEQAYNLYDFKKVLDGLKAVERDFPESSQNQRFLTSMYMVYVQLEDEQNKKTYAQKILKLAESDKSQDYKLFTVEEVEREIERVGNEN